MSKAPDNQLADNRYAFHQYEILEKFEAGIVLTGGEVKSIRHGQVNLKPAYAAVESGNIYLKQANISPYKQAHDFKSYDAERPRRLLLHAHEITYLEKQLQTKGYTLVPLGLYLKKGKIKVSLGLGKGKQAHDKRQDLKRKDQNREIERHFRKS